MKVRDDEQSVVNSGRLFHAHGPATAKALLSSPCCSAKLAQLGCIIISLVSPPANCVKCIVYHDNTSF